MSSEKTRQLKEDVATDESLLMIASERMSKCDPDMLISSDEMDKRLGISEVDLVGSDDVEFE